LDSLFFVVYILVAFSNESWKLDMAECCWGCFKAKLYCTTKDSYLVLDWGPDLPMKWDMFPIVKACVHQISSWKRWDVGHWQLLAMPLFWYTLLKH